MRGLKALFLVSGAAAALGIAIATAQSQPAGNGVYTTDQATIGATAYQTICAKCHQPDLRGGSEAPPLSGASFLSAWRGRTTSDLYTKIATSMPADNPRTLSDQAVGALVAFILRQNGALQVGDHLVDGSGLSHANRVAAAMLNPPFNFIAYREGLNNLGFSGNFVRLPSTGVATETSPRSSAMKVSHCPVTKHAPVISGCHHRSATRFPPKT